jgi:hypothetical protein
MDFQLGSQELLLRAIHFDYRQSFALRGIVSQIPDRFE